MLLANKADRFNTLRAVASPIVLFAPFVAGFPGGHGAFYFLLMFALIGETNYILHLHIHRSFGVGRKFNLLLDLAMGAATAFTASNWRIQHRYGHHCGVDEPFRAATWAMERFTPLGALHYSLRSIGPTFWHPVAIAFRKGVLANVKHPIDYRWAFAEQALMIALVIALAAWQPLMVLFYLLPWYVLIAAITRYVDYLNHYGCDERSRDVFARANNSVSRTFNWGCSNFGYHAAHHLRPDAHWTELPAIHADIEHRIPRERIKAFTWSSLAFPYHCLLAWRGRI